LHNIHDLGEFFVALYSTAEADEGSPHIARCHLLDNILGVFSLGDLHFFEVIESYQGLSQQGLSVVL
jgi:hypothetical protein